MLWVCGILWVMEQRIKRAAALTKAGFSAQTIANVLGMDISNFYKMKRECPVWQFLVDSAQPLSEAEKAAVVPYFIGHDRRDLRVAYAVSQFQAGHSVKEIAAALTRSSRTVLTYLKDNGIACGHGINHQGRGFVPDAPAHLISED